MKKSLLLFFMLCIFHPRAYSQTLTASDCNPVIGNRFKICQPANFSPGAGGPGQSWDFINLFCSGSTPYADTIIAPSATITAIFPNANIVRSFGGLSGSRVALKTSTAGLEKVADYNSSDTVKFTNPETQVFYPLTYSATYTDSYYSTHTYSTTSTHTTLISAIKNFTVDASGIMASPEGNFMNVLRVYSRAVESGTVRPENSTFTNTKDRYAWYAAGEHDPILSIDIYYPGQTNEYQITSYLYTHPNLVGMEELSSSKSMRMYPNPVSNELTIESEDSDVISILNTFGEILKEVSFDNQKKIILDLSSLSSGVYFVKILGNNKEPQLKKIIIEK